MVLMRLKVWSIEYILINVAVIFIVNFIKLDSKWLDINICGHVKLSGQVQN